MIPCFVISLSDCTERRNAITRSLNALGMDFEFVDAVDGRQGLAPVHEEQIDRSVARRRGRILSDAEYACALSHIAVCQRIAAAAFPYALILEDDAVPCPDLLEFLSGRHWQSTDLMQLHHGQSYVRRQGARPLFKGYVSYARAPGMKCPSAVAYTVSRQGAWWIARHARPVVSPADWPDCVDDLEGRCVHPVLVGHRADVGSLLNAHGRARNKDNRRVLGVYVPPLPKVWQSWKRAPCRLFCTRLPAPATGRQVP